MNVIRFQGKHSVRSPKPFRGRSSLKSPQNGTQPVPSNGSAEIATQSGPQADPTLRRLVQSRGSYTTGDARGRPQLTMRDAPVEQLHDQKRISEHQYQAAEKFRVHWFHSGLAGRVGNMFSGVVGWGSTSLHTLFDPEATCHHSKQIRLAWDVLGKVDGARELVYGVVWLERSLVDAGTLLGWKGAPQARAAAITQLRAALDLLADLWGMSIKRT